MQGTSFAHTLKNADAASSHDTQYYEMLGNRAIYHRGLEGGDLSRHARA